MEQLQSIFQKLKEAADSRVQIARLEVFTWQKISSAMHEASYYAGKWPEIKKPPKINVQETSSNRTKEYLTIKEVSQFLGLSRSTIYRLMSEEQIKYVKFGGSTRFNINDLKVFAEKYAV